MVGLCILLKIAKIVQNVNTTEKNVPRKLHKSKVSLKRLRKVFIP